MALISVFVRKQALLQVHKDDCGAEQRSYALCGNSPLKRGSEALELYLVQQDKIIIFGDMGLQYQMISPYVNIKRHIS